MSLYIYVVPCSPEQADKHQAWVEHARSLPLFTDHRCWNSGCMPKMPPLYEDSLELGRPMCNEGASQAEKWYGKQTIGDNEFTRWLTGMLKEFAGTEEGPIKGWESWIVAHLYQTVVVGNDNEWS
jgi:hypothetical protein